MPKFSLRAAFWMLAAGALLSLALAAAVRGEAWGIGVVMAFVLSLAALAVHAVFYGVARMVGLLEPRRRGDIGSATPTSRG